MGVKAKHWLVPGTVERNRVIRAACGKAIRRRRAAGQGQSFWQTLFPQAYREHDVSCTGCRRWFVMTPEERAQHTAQETAVKGAALEALRKRQAAAKSEKALATAAAIADARVQALAAFDAVLEGRKFDGLSEVIAAAVEMRCKDPTLPKTTKGRGRAWIFFEGIGDFPDYPYTHHESFAIVCRFCQTALGVGKRGFVYEQSTFNAKGVEVHRDVEDARVHVGRHTTLCALAYLLGVPHPEPIAR